MHSLRASSHKLTVTKHAESQNSVTETSEDASFISQLKLPRITKTQDGFEHSQSHSNLGNRKSSRVELKEYKPIVIDGKHPTANKKDEPTAA